MEEDDERFKEIVSDPRFRTLRRNERKVKIDKRFMSMFNEKRFKLKYSVDKRGRNVKFSNTDHLKKVYEVSDNDDEDNDQGMPDKNADEDVNSRKSEDNQECIPVRQGKSLAYKFTDLRGENNADQSSSSDEENSEEEEEKREVDHIWGELDKDAPRSESISSRLAVCNIDWDRIKASDLFILFSTFNTKIGTIKSVKIYPSKFGKERMKEEEFNGPKELVQVTLKEDEEDPFAKSNDQDNEVINSESSFISEKLREYQIKRLKYYYAVIECKNEETALHLYKELDGLEYESSASTLDIRFIPDDVTFDDEVPSSECSSMPLLADYEPPTFVTTALQQSKVKLTWDETDPERNIKLRKAFTNLDKADDDLLAYLASDNEDKEDEAGTMIEQTNLDKDEDDDHRLLKYKELLKSLDEAKEKEKPKFEMEVTWEPNLEQKSDQDSDKEMTLFEKEKAKKRKAKKVPKVDTKGKKEEDGCNKNDLNLLVLDKEEKKKHFDYNDFIDDKSKRKRKKKRAKIDEQEDHFKVSLHYN